MANKKITLSVVLAVFNEEGRLASCLDSVKDIADEIVIVDGGSTDKTVEIAKKYNAKIIRTGNPPMFHINKQKALDAAESDWILQLDADEHIPGDLKGEILSTINDTTKAIHGYFIPRRNYFWGHFMKKGGQYPDYVIRLLKKGKGVFPCKSVHEQIIIAGEPGYLTHPMLHYSYMTKNDYWKKADAYTTLTALDMKQKKVSKNIFSWFHFSIYKPLVTFFSIYLRHKGFVDGVTGFEFALYSGMHHAIAYTKYLKLS